MEGAEQKITTDKPKSVSLEGLAESEELAEKLKKCVFFESDSCLADCLPVFFQKVFDNGKLKVKLSSKGFRYRKGFGARTNE